MAVPPRPDTPPAAPAAVPPSTPPGPGAGSATGPVAPIGRRSATAPRTGGRRRSSSLVKALPRPARSGGTARRQGPGEPTESAAPADGSSDRPEPIGRTAGGTLARPAGGLLSRPATATAAGTGSLAERQLTGTPGQVIEVEPVGTTVRIFRVGKPAGLDFRAGQYLKVGVPGSRKGSFTIASAPHDSHLELCVELIAGGRLTPRMFAVGAGGRLDVDTKAKGSFVLDRGGRTHVMVATVTGIAPLRSMLRDALHKGSTDSFIVLHGASYADELPYHDELAALAASDSRVTYTPTVSRPREARNASWTGATGRVDALAAEVVPTLDALTTRVYACGNPGMIDTVTSTLRQRGLKVLSEKFD